MFHQLEKQPPQTNQDRINKIQQSSLQHSQRERESESESVFKTNDAIYRALAQMLCVYLQNPCDVCLKSYRYSVASSCCCCCMVV